MELLCDFCFREMNLHKLRVSVFAFNEAAVRCYLSCGFREEGRLEKELWRDGAYRDVLDSVALCRRVTGKTGVSPLFRSESVFCGGIVDNRAGKRYDEGASQKYSDVMPQRSGMMPWRIGRMKRL